MIFSRRMAVLTAVCTLAMRAPASAQGLDLATQVGNKAALAVDQFQKRAKGRLDYSEQSLAVVDDMLAEAFRHLKEISSDDVNSLVELMGSYILEVGRRKYGGVYQWFEADAQPVLIVGQPKFSIGIMTFDKVRGRLSGDKADNIVFFYKGFSARVKAAVPGTNALYV
jgi:hypothetical protein